MFVYRLYEVNMDYKKSIAQLIKIDGVSEDEIYSLLDVDGLSLPEYPYFAVDYCRRLNLGFANYFAIKDKCAAISFNTGDFAIMNGIASHKKGFGGVALKNILAKMLSTQHKVQFTPASYNTPLGLSLFINNELKTDTKFVILEYGDGTVVLALRPDIFYEFFFHNTKKQNFRSLNWKK